MANELLRDLSMLDACSYPFPPVQHSNIETFFLFRVFRIKIPFRSTGQSRNKSMK